MKPSSSYDTERSTESAAGVGTISKQWYSSTRGQKSPTSVVRNEHKQQQQNQKESKSNKSPRNVMNIFDVICSSGCYGNQRSNRSGNYSRTSSPDVVDVPEWDHSFLCLDGLTTIILGKASAIAGDDNEEEGTEKTTTTRVFLEDDGVNKVIDDAVVRWIRTMETRIHVGRYVVDDGNGFNSNNNNSFDANQFDCFTQNGDYDEGRSRRRRGRERQQQQFMEESNIRRQSIKEVSLTKHKRCLAPVHDIALERLMQKEFTDALEHFKLTLDSARDRYGENHAIVSVATHNLGMAHLLVGHNDEALYYFHDAALLKKAILDPNDPSITESLIEVGILLYAKKEYHRALTVFTDARKVIDGCSSSPSSSSSPCLSFSPRRQCLHATVLQNTACILFEMGDHVSSLSYLQKALTIRRLALSSSQATMVESKLLSMATIYYNLGAVHMTMGMEEDALVAFEDALLVQESVLGDCNETVSDTRSKIDACKKRLSRLSSLSSSSSQNNHFSHQHGVLRSGDI